jgi:hypothetical protein
LYSSLCGTDLVKFEGLARNIGYVEGLSVVSAVSAVLIAGIRGPLRFFAVRTAGNLNIVGLSIQSLYRNRFYLSKSPKSCCLLYSS